MKISLGHIFWLFPLGVLFACQAEGGVSVKIHPSSGAAAKASFRAEVAKTPSERAQGLMYRQTLGKHRGMLFVFDEDGASPFWMHNTLIPLDMIFIGRDKKIISIVTQATPQTDTPREAAAPYRYVLEIEGGRAKELGIVPGDRVEFDLP